MNNRVKLDFGESRNISSHAMDKIDALNWLKIWNADDFYFDSDRRYGYGGYHYDGRWHRVVSQLKEKFSLGKLDNLLDLGAAKGFLVNDYNCDPEVGEAVAADISLYSLISGKRLNMVGKFICCNFTELPFEDKEFELVFSKDSLHNILSKEEIILALKEIERVGKKAWIRVGAYKNSRQKEIIDNWAVFASTYLHIDEWLELFNDAGYSGNFDWFHPSEQF